MDLEKQILASTSQTEIDNIVTAAKNKHNRHYRVFNILNVVGIMCSAFLLFADHATFDIFITLIAIWLVLNGVIIFSTPDLNCSLQPNDNQCEKALAIVSSSSAARAYRNNLVANGIQLTLAHIWKMEALQDEEHLEMRRKLLNSIA